MLCPEILVHVHFVKKFVPQNVQRLSRFYHCVMVGAACSYLIELDMQINPQPNDLTRRQSQDNEDQVSWIDYAFG